MDRSHNWKLVGILLILLGVAGCATAYRENAADEAPVASSPTYAALDRQFTGDRLSPAQLKAFETRAQQKLSDFIDYVNIVADSSLDSTFRAEAMQQAEQLFVSPQARVTIQSLRQKEGEDTSVHHLLSSLLRNDAPAFRIDTLSVHHPLTLQDSARYRGALSFYVTGLDQPTKHQASFIIQKADKRFGQETLSTWVVLLESIR